VKPDAHLLLHTNLIIILLFESESLPTLTLNGCTMTLVDGCAMLPLCVVLLCSAGGSPAAGRGQTVSHQRYSLKVQWVDHGRLL